MGGWNPVDMLQSIVVVQHVCIAVDIQNSLYLFQSLPTFTMSGACVCGSGAHC